MLPSTDQAHNKHMWNVICNFNQSQVITPWWWILRDPKHVGLIFNVCLLDFYITQILKSTIVLISRLIKVTNHNDVRWKPEINVANWNIFNNMATLLKFFQFPLQHFPIFQIILMYSFQNCVPSLINLRVLYFAASYKDVIYPRSY